MGKNNTEIIKEHINRIKEHVNQKFFRGYIYLICFALLTTTFLRGINITFNQRYWTQMSFIYILGMAICALAEAVRIFCNDK